MKFSMMCPCKSQKKYNECCRPYHEKTAHPQHAVALMRSRYSAYALGLADYIIETTHPDHPEMSLKIWEWREQILQFSRETEFLDLEILNSEEGKEKAYVTFTAFLMQEGKDSSYTEKSLFEQKDGVWLYKEAEFL
jgi:SEC-C motif-containing protein